MLERIPIEVLRIILSNVRAKSDLFNLCLTSKKLHSLALPKLHESLTMFTGDYTLEPLVLPGSGPTGELVWKYLRKLTISGLGWADTLDRCHHHNPAYYSDRAVSPGKDPIEMMEKDFFPSINALPDHQLREFRWELGICVPKFLLGRNGYLPTKQRKIETMFLFTNSRCSRHTTRRVRLNFKNFGCIRDFSWVGLASPYDFQAVGHVLSQNAARLKSLRLELTAEELPKLSGWYVDESLHLCLPKIMSEIISRKSETLQPAFPSLLELSLANMSFKKVIPSLVDGLNFSNLYRLRLQDCPHSYGVLKYAMQMQIPIRLKSFEFVVTEEEIYTEEGGLDTLCLFLKSFRGLDSAYILLPGTQSLDPLARALLNHQETLRRLVMHSVKSRDWNDFQLNECMSLQFLDQLPKLICIGMDVHIRYLLSSCSKSRFAWPKCEILHIRASRWSDSDFEERDNFGDMEESFIYQGNTKVQVVRPPLMVDDETDSVVHVPCATQRNFLHFAEWAFGRYGLPNLKLLLYGDFSPDESGLERTMLLCRNKGFSESKEESSTKPNLTYNRVREEDWPLWELYHEHHDFLSACAVGERPEMLDRDDSSPDDYGLSFSDESDNENFLGISSE